MHEYFQRQNPRRNEGHVRVEPKKDNSIPDEGEYVDYTEIK